MAAIGDLFKGAEGIMTWLKLCARVICKSIPSDRAHALANLRSSYGTQECLTREQMAAVVWTTPLGLPVVQPYRREKKKQVQTAIQTVYISDPHAPQEVNGMKQASAFPPNFIHSLDATHMMLTALECRVRLHA
jgi:DNA-directed RNA polymerase